jgi:hypothetical protein
VDKANIFRVFAFFRSIFDEEAKAFPDLIEDHAYVVATALLMVQKPWDFDVMVTENMFGDVLSDLGAVLMGGLGVAPSADIGLEQAVFQPCHGSALDIAGQGKANPIALIENFAGRLSARYCARKGHLSCNTRWPKGSRLGAVDAVSGCLRRGQCALDQASIIGGQFGHRKDQFVIPELPQSCGHQIRRESRWRICVRGACGKRGLGPILKLGGNGVSCFGAKEVYQLRNCGL